MNIIPVLDLKGGCVVRAERGERQHYRPLRSCLCPSAEPPRLLAALLALHPFRQVYIADLDAITGGASNRPLIEKLLEDFPGTTFWIDQGFPAHFPNPADNEIHIIGSESLTIRDLDQLRHRSAPFILSLDFREKILGPAELLEQRDLWPSRVIVMSLRSVGSGQGPDWGRLARLIGMERNVKWIAAGGVRHRQDLVQLKRMGIDAALLATAIHDGTLGRQVLQRYAT